MGARFSSIQENGTPAITATAAPTSLPPAYHIPSSRWSSKNSMVESRVTPACSPHAPANCNNPSTNTIRPSVYPAANKTTVFPPPASAAGGAVAKVAERKRVIAFHSATKWREYFEASKQSNKLVVIYFTATWCGPCRYMEPTINELAAKCTDVDLVKIDVDELFNISRQFGIQTMPTFLFMKKGKQVDKVVGARKEDFQKKVEKHRA
ncbi:hypothetical protein BVRB_6g154810 [Beta vulgaris subsp. vulgaris]|nr:hypothetical protein BVRB_6g154810 [Beta vulgaris subsp. vulgaris]